MQANKPENFYQNVKDALAQPDLKMIIRRTTDKAEAKRAEAIANFPGFENARKQGQKVKDHTIKYMDHYLAEFEKNALAQGTIIHWASTAEEASKIVLDICRQHEAKKVTRSKSMLGEEIGLSHALDNSGIERVETDLAEHIIQLAGDPPSHIVWPAMHRSREDVIKLFREYHKDPTYSEEIIDLVRSARRDLRTKFLTADIGISGSNFLLADSGSSCTVTNEGNAELTITPPKVHIVTAGIEKLVPSMAHAIPLLRLLTRSATGSEITQYITFHNGAKRPNDADGPEECHMVLVDNGRTKMLADGMEEMLRCIRCGACMNHCVVYKHIGGHAYGSVYPGPMGSVLTPHLNSLEVANKQTHACTLNGRCEEVCPVNIPLPKLLRSLRAQSWDKKYEPLTNRFVVKAFAALAKRPMLFQWVSSCGVIFMKLCSRKGWIRSMPLAGGWTRNRDLIEPESKTFMQQYKAMKKAKSDGA
ncbi:lactate utilization protein B [Neptuniibacter pectenicola]|mgnify:FL=1|jgi:L-lactate dehydrogenase complex protein LldF|uniref:Lactate utilization protein B n=1 Tax=Neptuniibacter pectenicola TaxID=1806669 RepID=A0ABU9TSI7_9GAMM|nr:lactate utilization protein B [Neptuniibacter pectenicola]KXJ53711.1 MAG: (Fe-S)-binding protein [Neptuniibacter sp. Phe_28]|tara:strand:- start:1535 stop:2959 length:1425 start_codon:yes stop_codon:yes gene_type:complete